MKALSLRSMQRSWRWVLVIAALSWMVTAGCDDEDGDDDDGGATTTTSIGASTTTTSASTTTTTIGATTTTTSASTTTVTLCSSATSDGSSVRGCSIVWSVTNDVTLGALQFNTDYSAAQGELPGSLDQVSCEDLTASLASFNDIDATNRLSAGFINLTGFDAPRDVMRCEFIADCGATADPRPADFVVTVIDAADPSLAPVTADVAVTSAQCQGSGAPTSTTTSTTLGLP